MGFIKSIQTSLNTSFSSQMNDTFKEVIRSGGFESGQIVKRVTTDNGVIADKSRMFVEPGECAIFVDNGAIKDVVAEPGMYFMDTSSPTLFQSDFFKGLGATIIQAGKRIAYEGIEINRQVVFYINLTEQIGLPYGTTKPVLYSDPTWGPIEISINGQYSIKVTNPVDLLTNILGNKESLYSSDLEDAIRPYIIADISTEVSNSGLSFDELSTKQSTIADKVKDNVSSKILSTGVSVEKVVVSNFDVPESIKESMRNRTDIKMKATSVNNEEADVFEKLSRAEAMKDLANNPNSSGSTIMGMNMGNMFGANISDANKKDSE